MLGLQKKPLLDEFNYGDTVSNWHAFNFYSYDYFSKEVRTIYEITLNNASSTAYTLTDSTIGPQHTSEREGANEVGRCNSTVRG